MVSLSHSDNQSNGNDSGPDHQYNSNNMISNEAHIGMVVSGNTSDGLNSASHRKNGEATNLVAKVLANEARR